MKKRARGKSRDELRPQYDLKTLLKHGVRGKYVRRYREGTNLILLDRDVARAFPDAESVNAALRLLLKIQRLPLRADRRGST